MYLGQRTQTRLFEEVTEVAEAVGVVEVAGDTVAAVQLATLLLLM